MSHRTCCRYQALGTVASLITLAAATPALARAVDDPTPQGQVAPATDPQSDQDSDRLSDIVVTAQRREQNLQSVPITITAITPDKALASGVTQTSDIPSLVSGVNFNRLTANPQLFIRGIGTQNVNTGEEGSNPVYLDGFYNPSLPAAIFSFNSIERIEVLKGPQGTLFGRNSMGGAINVVTRDPGQETRLEASAGFGNYDTIDAGLYASTGLGKNVAADLSLYLHDQLDGFGTNRFNGADVNYLREFAARSKFVITPDADTRITLAADYDHSSSNLGFAIHIIPGAFAAGSLQTYPGDYYDVNSDLQPRGFVEQWGLQARISREIGAVRLVSMTGYRHVDTQFYYDADTSAVAVFHAFFPGLTKGFTQEFQLLANSDSKVQWVIGAFYLDASAQNDQVNSGSALNAIGGVQQLSSRIGTDSIAGYAETTVPLGSSTEITGGIRYTRDKKSLDFVQTLTNINVVQTRKESNTWDAFTWRAALSHHFSNDIMIYGSVSRGFKSGSYNSASFSNPVVDPEHLTAYEIGFRSEVLDKHLRFNASAFHYDYSDIQLLQSVGGVAGSILTNAAAAKVDGLDVEVVARPVPNLTVGLGGTFLFRHEYISFPGAPASTPNAVPPGGNRTFFADASGNTMIQSPDFSGYSNISYRIPISSGGDVTVTGNFSYNSGYFSEADNRRKQPAYGLLNGQIAWRLSDDRFTIRLWGRNLTDKKYALYLKTSLVDGIAPAAPRTYGAALDVKL